MSFCVYCGTRLPDESRFCSKCGKPVFKAEAEPVPAEETMQGRKREMPETIQSGNRKTPEPMQAGYREMTGSMPDNRMNRPDSAPADPLQGPVFYQGICLKREDSWNTIGGDCVITPAGMYYYSRSEFRCQIGKRPYDFWVNSAEVAEIRTSRKNMNKVMELHMKDGAVLEFYSSKFAQMLSAMQQAVNGRR